MNIRDYYIWCRFLVSILTSYCDDGNGPLSVPSPRCYWVDLDLIDAGQIRNFKAYFGSGNIIRTRP